MNAIRIWILLAVVGLAGTVAQGQKYEDPAEDQRGLGAVPEPAFLFTDSIIDRAIDRIADGMQGHYDFDEDQVWQAREVFKERFPQWLQENRVEIITVVNQYAEALLGAEPPTPEEVAEWSARVMPLVNDFTGLVEETSVELRTFMTDEQQLILDGEMAVFNVGIKHLNSRLQNWSEGGYNWEYDWPRSKEFKGEQRKREQQLEAEAIRAKQIALGMELETLESGGGAATTAPGEAESRPSAEDPRKARDEWADYVEDFIKRYQLDDGQQNQARRVLRSLQEDRDAYLRRILPEIEALGERLKSATTSEEHEQVRSEYERLNEPLERRFDRLKDRLEPIPTRKQRRAAAARTEMETRPREEPKAGAEQE